MRLKENGTSPTSRISRSKTQRMLGLEIPTRRALEGITVREADRLLLAKAPKDFLDTTHFDTVRFPPPEWALTTFAEAAADGALAYTGYRGHPSVLTAVAENVGKFMGMEIDPKQSVILTPGTQGALFCVLSAIVNVGARVVILDPDYLFAERILGFLGADVAHVPLRFADEDPRPDLAALEAEFAVRGTKFFVFSHPNNPTGAVFSKEVIERIAELAVRYDVTVVADELYSRLIHEGAYSHLAAEKGMASRTVTLLGPSKTESMSGYRLGVAIARPARIADIENVLSIAALRAPAYAQHLLKAWLRDDHAWLAARQVEFTALRALTIAKLSKLPWLKVVQQRGTAYAWCGLGALQLAPRSIAEALLVEAGVLVSPGYQFGPTSADHIRLCYARDEAEWTAALDRIVDVLARLAKQHGVTGIHA
jgi:aspartate/methionine/tyrosine aminotransferase